MIFTLLSLINFTLYGLDKYKAKRKLWRIPEKVLLGCSFLGGAIGGTVAMSLFRHKTKHWYFWAVNIIGLAWQAALLILLLI
ncbi:MAG: DUF1294 domain-containing protein [Ruminococcaceae bacterium]|nr:DUF1294 domain-containing protein [Oscillospiraceae bacterium]